MSYFWRSRKKVHVASVVWYDSRAVPGVRFAVRRVSIGQRLELTRRARELALKNEFLRAGDSAEKLEAALADLLAKRMYLEWGLHAVQGLSIDGRTASVADVVDKAPEAFADEVLDTLRAELGLTENERKNS